MVTVEHTGIVLSVQLLQLEPYAPDYRRESYDIKLDITIQSIDGRVRFRTPAARYTISQGGPYYVAVIRENDWIKKGEPWDSVGFAGARGVGHTYRAGVSAGDMLPIRGRPRGNNPTQLNYVKLIKHVKGKIVEVEEQRP